MGLFKKIKKKVKQVAKVGQRITAGVVTAGLSETSVGKNIGKTIGSVLVPTSLSDLATGFQAASIPIQAITNPAGAAAAAGSLISGNSNLPEGTTGGSPMALGNVLGGLQGVLNQVSGFGGPAGAVASIGSGFLSGFLPAQGPRVSQFPQAQFPQATQTMSITPAIVQGTAMIAGILARISASVGRNISFRAAMIIVRRLMKTLQSPTAVATALGIGISELSTLLVANSISKSSGRRMNVGNVKALRRAHRRIKSFHKLCGDNDRLRAPRRRTAPKVINVSGRAC